MGHRNTFAAELERLRRERLARRVADSVLPVHAHAHQAARWQRLLRAAESEREFLRAANPELWFADAQRRAVYGLVWLGALLIYLLDFFVLSAIAEYFALLLYAGQPLMVSLVRAVIPAAIIVVEMMISCHHALTREEDEFSDPYQRGGRRQWAVFSALLLVMLSCMLIATHLVTLPDGATGWWLGVSGVQLLGLLGLTLTLHGVVLYGGHTAVAAKAYLYLKLHDRQLRRRLRRAEENYQQAAAAVTRAYARHESLAHEFCAGFPAAALPPAIFDATTTAVLQEHLQTGPGTPFATRYPAAPVNAPSTSVN